MRLDKKHKPYVAILGVALSALFVDAFLMGEGEAGPAQAAASPAPAPGGAPVQAAATPEKSAAPAQPSGPRLAARLTAVRSARPAPEGARLFANAEEWLVPPAPEKAPDSAFAGSDAAASPSEGLPVLSSVLAAGERSCVIINGRTLRIGEQIGDARLHAVDQTGATFERNGQLVRVEVQVR